MLHDNKSSLSFAPIYLPLQGLFAGLATSLLVSLPAFTLCLRRFTPRRRRMASPIGTTGSQTNEPAKKDE
jgi:hypothetical protein